MAATASSEGQEKAGPRTLAEKIEWLIAHKWPAGPPPPKTNDEVVKAIRAATGEDMSRATIWKLRTGRSDNPTLKTLTALRAFFRLPSIGYFDEGEESESIGDQVVLLALLRENGVDRRALRSLAELSPDGRAVIVDMIDSVARREQQRGKPGTQIG